jgi:hypothetical protein
MAITQGTVKLKIVMNRGAAGTPVFAFTDQSNYDDFSVVKGALKIEYGSTVYYDNLSNIDLSPDINGGSLGQANEALTRANTIATPVDLPVNASDEVVSGQYKFTYNVKEGAGATITNIVVVDATFSSVNGNMTSVVNLTPTAPSITVTDTTNYVVQNVTPTGTPQITLYYPADAAASPTVVNASQLVANAFYTGEQIAKLSSTKIWDYSNKLVSSTFTSGYFTLLISDLVTDRIQINVEADNNLCAIFCCLKDFAAKILAAKSNPTTYKHYVDIAGQVAFFYNSIASAYECSKTENVNLWIEEIRNLVGCTDDCGCTDGAPILITAIPEAVTASLTVTDGVNTVTSANTLTFSGATVSGSGGDATITIEGGGGSGTVTEVTANAPLSVATGTTTPDLTIEQATTSTDGYLSSTDWNTFNNKGAGTVTEVTGAGAISVINGNSTPEVSVATADAATTGVLSSTDWNTFNNKAGINGLNHEIISTSTYTLTADQYNTVFVVNVSSVISIPTAVADSWPQGAEVHFVSGTPSLSIENEIARKFFYAGGSISGNYTYSVSAAYKFIRIIKISSGISNFILTEY